MIYSMFKFESGNDKDREPNNTRVKSTRRTHHGNFAWKAVGA
jgi:hypothetical protein